jgi:uncharacterized protein YcfJ
MKHGYRITICTLALSAGVAYAQAPIVYPDNGQSASLQQKGQGECRAWATQNTSVDPARLAAAPVAASEPPPQGERLRGAARGAVGGAAIGAITHSDRSDAAAVGAVIGTMAGQQQQMDTWNRAVSASLESRGYTVR